MYQVQLSSVRLSSIQTPSGQASSVEQPSLIQGNSRKFNCADKAVLSLIGSTLLIAVVIAAAHYFPV